MRTWITGLLLLVLGMMPAVAGETNAGAGTTADIAKSTAPAPKKVVTFPHVRVDREAREMRVEAELSGDAYLLEFFLIYNGDPELDRGYESVFVTKANPAHVHLGLMLMGLMPGPLAKTPTADLTKDNKDHVEGERADSKEAEHAPAVEIWVEWDADGKTKTARGESFMFNRETAAVARNTGWRFTGSYLVTQEGQKILAANKTYVIASVFHDESGILNLPYFTKNPHRDPQERPEGTWGMVVDPVILPREFVTSRTFRVGDEMVTKKFPRQSKVTLIFRPAAEATQKGAAEETDKTISQKIDKPISWYFSFNNITPQPISVGMTQKDLVKILGEPTKKYYIQDGRKVVTPGKDAELWYAWYHNPRGMHVAPYINCRMEDGVVREIRAGRG